MLKVMMTASAFALLAMNVNAAEPDDHAPIGVMADHKHKAGEWMFSYRYGHMEMDGMRSGNDDLSMAQVHANYMVAPLSMKTDMHMFGAMHGITDGVTAMVMLPYIEKSMNHQTRMGQRFTTRTEGIGDVKASVTIGLIEDVQQAADSHSHTGDTLLLNAGASLPTGSVDERDTTPMGPNQKLPYPMQLGSGTIDPSLGLTYTHAADGWSAGAQANATWRLGKNDEGYRLGDEYKATAWAAKNLNENVSVSARLEGKHWGEIDGRDAALNPMMVPTARADFSGGTRVDALIGVNLIGTEGALDGHRLALEGGVPIYQRLDGIQMKMENRIMIGWQKAF